MKKLLMFVGLVTVLVVVLPLIRYRTLDPCQILREEIVDRTRERARDMSAEAREEAGTLGADIGRVAEGIGSSVEKAAAGIAGSLTDLRTEDMSGGGCLREFIELKLGLGED